MHVRSLRLLKCATVVSPVSIHVFPFWGIKDVPIYRNVLVNQNPMKIIRGVGIKKNRWILNCPLRYTAFRQRGNGTFTVAGWHVSPRLPCPFPPARVLSLGDSLMSVSSIHAHIYNNTVKR
jgi:hypothetical protein